VKLEQAYEPLAYTEGDRQRGAIDIRSYKEGAASFFPKERMTEIPALVNELLESLERGKSPCLRWLDRGVSFCDEKFGPDWKNKDKEFWENFNQWD
jgi:hypothetical protein